MLAQGRLVRDSNLLFSMGTYLSTGLTIKNSVVSIYGVFHWFLAYFYAFLGFYHKDRFISGGLNPETFPKYAHAPYTNYS